MSTDEQIDPYRKWLGIRDPQRPPNHYRLLGLELYEDDPEVIQNAADQRMAHVRTYSTGRHSELSQKILNEIAAAKVCLLNKEKRERYNQQLGEVPEGSGLNLGAPPPNMGMPPPPPSGAQPPRAVPVQPIEQQYYTAQPAEEYYEAEPDYDDEEEEVPDFSRPSSGTGFDASSLNAMMGEPAPQAGRFPMEGSSISESASSMSIGRARKKNDSTIAIVVGVGLAAVAMIAIVLLVASGGDDQPKPVVETPETPIDPVERPDPRPNPKRNPLRDSEEKFTIEWPSGLNTTEEGSPSPAQRHRLNHQYGVIGVGWAPANNLALTADWNGNIAGWNPETGSKEFQFSTANEPIALATFSPQGSHVLIGKRSGDLELWHLETQTLERTFKGHSAQITAAVFVPDGGRFLSTALDGTLRMWAVDRSNELKQWEFRRSCISLAVSPERPFLVAGHRGFISALNYEEWDNAKPIRLSRGEFITGAVFLPGGDRFLTAGSDQTLRVWEWNQESPAREFRGSKDTVWCVAVHPRGRYAVSGTGASYNFGRKSWNSSHDSSLRVWEFRRKQNLKPLQGHGSTVWAAQFHPTQPLLLSGSFDGTARIWDLTKLEQEGQTTPELVSKEDAIQPSDELLLGSQFAPDDLVLSFEFDPDDLAISAEPVPEASDDNSIPAVKLPAELQTDEGQVRRPAPLLSQEQMATYQANYAELVSKVSRDNATALAQQLLKDARNQSENPGLARYLTLRAFGIAEQINYRVEPALAAEALNVFGELNKNLQPEQRLAVTLAHVNMIEQMRLIYRRNDNKTDAELLDRKLLAAIVAAAKAYQDYGLFDEARKLLTPKAITDIIRETNDKTLAQTAERLKESNQKLWEKQRRLLDLVEQWQEKGPTPELKGKLGLFCLGELGNIETAAKLLKDSDKPEHQQIAQAYTTASEDPSQLLALTESLQTLAKGAATEIAPGCLEVAADALNFFLRQQDESAPGYAEAKQSLSDIQLELVGNRLNLPQVVATAETIAFDLGQSRPLAMRLIPAGNFKMAGEIDVTLTQPFYIGMTEVTQSQWQALMGTEPSQHSGDPMLPVENVSWEDAQQFLKALNARFAGRFHFRLPTEAEWEYACRAGSTSTYSFGDQSRGLLDHAWFRTNAQGQPHPVATKQPNAWGLYDMHGNVREWVQDWASTEPIAGPLVDPQGPDTGTSRLLCGGGFDDGPRDLQCNQRFGFPPTKTFSNTGFRVVAIPRRRTEAIASAGTELSVNPAEFVSAPISKAPPSAADEPFPQDDWVDVTELLVTKGKPLSGKWEQLDPTQAKQLGLEDFALRTRIKGPAVFATPLVVNGSYELQFTSLHLEGHAQGAYLPLGRRWVTVIVSARENALSLVAVRGLAAFQPGNPTIAAHNIPLRQPVQWKYVVERLPEDEVSVKILAEGKPLTGFQGPVQALSVHKYWQPPAKGAPENGLLFCGNDSEVIYTAIQVKKTAGTMKTISL